MIFSKFFCLYSSPVATRLFFRRDPTEIPGFQPVSFGLPVKEKQVLKRLLRRTEKKLEMEYFYESSFKTPYAEAVKSKKPIMKSLEKPPPIVEEFAKKLPRFPDGRIDYSKSESAPVLTCFIQYKDKVLILKRSRKVSNYKEKWNAVSGYFDELKPLREKVMEEIQEELGISPEDVSVLKVAEPYEFKDEDIQKRWIVHPVLIILRKEPQITLDWEHDEYTWINPNELASLDTIPKLVDSLQRLLNG